MSSLRLLGAAGALALVLASPAAAHKRHHHHHHHTPRTSRSSSSRSTTSTATSQPPGRRHGHRPRPTAPPRVDDRPGGAEYPREPSRELSAANPQHARRLGRRPDRRQPAAVRALPRRADDRGDEPLGLDLNAVGNHEFDEGAAELLRMQNGGCHPVDGCHDGDGFAGADFHFLAANVIDNATGKTALPALRDPTFDGVKVGFIGMTLEGTPTIVSAGGIPASASSTRPTPPTATPRAQAPHGVEAIVVLLHEGGFPTAPFNAGNRRVRHHRAVVDIVERHRRSRRPRRLGPHAPGLHLRRSTAARSPAPARSAARDRHRPDDRPRSGRQVRHRRQQPDLHARRRRRTRTPQLVDRLRRCSAPIADRRRRPRSPPDITAGATDDVAARTRRQPDRRRPARRHRRRRRAARSRS